MSVYSIELSWGTLSRNQRAMAQIGRYYRAVEVIKISGPAKRKCLLVKCVHTPRTEHIVKPWQVRPPIPYKPRKTKWS